MHGLQVGGDSARVWISQVRSLALARVFEESAGFSGVPHTLRPFFARLFVSFLLLLVPLRFELRYFAFDLRLGAISHLAQHQR